MYQRLLRSHGQSWGVKALLLGLLGLLLASCGSGSDGSRTADLPSLSSTLISDISVLDGSGEPAFAGAVRIDRGEIIEVGNLEPLAGEVVVDGQGLYLAPGFIDTHSHHDSGLVEATDATAAISQGITTIVVGNDGSSRATMEQLATQMQDHPPALNVASYTGHGTIRGAVMGEDYKREASGQEIAQMASLLERELAAGSVGLSTGLEYDPGIYSNTAEVVTLAKVAAAAGGRYISHMRSEDRALEPAIEELLQIGREADIPVQISHFKLASTDLWGEAPRILERLDRARAEGIDVTADLYPYTFWQSTLTVLLPERDFYDLAAARYALEKLAPADGLTLVNYAPDPSLIGKTVAEVAANRGKSNEEAYLELIRDVYENDSWRMEGEETLEQIPEMVMGESMSEEDVAELIAWPHTNLCSDGYGAGHPRGHGAYPRAYRLFVREQGVLSPEQMIHKMSGLAAKHMGFKDRGLIRPGYAADLVLFDPHNMTDRATIENPQQISKGVIGVWVNGERVWDTDRVLSARPGRLITRQ